MASRETRARLAAAGAVYVCPRPQVQRAQGACAAALEALGSGAPPSARWCGRAHRVHGRGVPRALRLPWRCASRWASRCPMGPRGVWWGDRGGRHTRRRWRFAPGWPKRWRRLRLYNQRGRGKKRVETVSALRQAVVALIQRDGVDDLVWFRLPPPVTSRPVRASRAQPARVDHDHEATVEVCVAEAAVEATVRRVGWRV